MPEYLSPDFRPGAARILAHRGLAQSADFSVIDENTMKAFEVALDVRADYLESDIQVTSDGIPVLFHDDDLSRIAGRPERINELTLVELQKILMPGGSKIPTLEQALIDLPGARFNLDFKVWPAVQPAAEVINRLGAANRILVASFSERRRKQASKLINATVASSAGGSRVIWLYVAHLLRLDSLFAKLAWPVSALQVPTAIGIFKFANPKFIRRAQKHGLEVHFWTINSAEEMSELILMGADGLVTDRADLARQISDSLA
jgi:glycerophosphoryl diester phosphodiesterase